MNKTNQYGYVLPVAMAGLLTWGTSASASSTANLAPVAGAGSMDALVMILLLGGFRMIGWIAQRVDRRMQKQAALSSEY